MSTFRLHCEAAARVGRVVQAEPFRLAMPVALALVVLTVGGAPSVARATPCSSQTDVVFYAGVAGDATRLAPELAKFASSCADYYISIQPLSGGIPRGGAPLATIHALGPRFHAMAEIRLKPWAEYTGDNGDWYATGVHVRDLMAQAGYDPSRDTWAVNEVGEPSGQSLGVEVLRNVEARQKLRDFVRGLYTGNGVSNRGLVFAADPLHVTTDLLGYREALDGFYADSAFWEDMSSYVDFWAQEAYADARSWGVPGSTLAERSAHLDDYSLHGIRLAETRGAGTEAARAFFARAYTALGNATFRATAPETRGIGFGFTDIPLPAMLNFVSTQTYAFRSSAGSRFGFADQRISSPTPTTGPEMVAIEDRLAEAIQRSEADPSGACGANGEWCDGTVEGAQFNDAWKDVGNPTAPTIVPHFDGPKGNDGWYTGDVTVTWDVTDAESAISQTQGCGATTIDFDTDGTTLTCTATSVGGTAPVTVTVRRDATPPTVTCVPTPSTLWPPNHQLVPVDIALIVTDATSGPSTFALTDTSTSIGDAASDIAGFDVETPDIAGFLRAERPGTASERLYRLTYTAEDVAGNTTDCDATVVVPHDRASVALLAAAGSELSSEEPRLRR